MAKRNAEEIGGKYPHEYTPDGLVRLVAILAGFAPLALVLVTSLLRYFGSMNAAFRSSDLIPIAMTGALALWFLFMVSQRVILYEDGIQKVTWLSSRRLDRENILGWRGGLLRRGGYTYVLVPRQLQKYAIAAHLSMGQDIFRVEEIDYSREKLGKEGTMRIWGLVDHSIARSQFSSVRLNSLMNFPASAPSISR
jgi:hypothetical protein